MWGGGGWGGEGCHYNFPIPYLFYKQVKISEQGTPFWTEED